MTPKKARQTLDGQVATEVMGYLIVSWPHLDKEDLDTSKSYAVVDGENLRLFRFGLNDGHIWSPSKNIAEAFEMQKQIQERGLENVYAHALQKIIDKEARQSACTYWWFLVNATPEQRCLAALEAARSAKQ